MQKLTLKNLCDIDGLLEYLDALENLKNTLIVICIKDNAGKCLDDQIQKKLYKLGLNENLIDKLMVGYIALIKNSDVIYERLSKRDGTEEYADMIDNHDIHVISQPFLSGNLASVSIDQTEYAVNERGLNFVIFDLNRNEVIDSVSFDTHVEEYTCKRVKEPAKNHYDVCLVGCWFGSNYGSLLNGYAVYNILKSFGLEVLLLNKHNALNQDWEICGTHNERFIKQFYPKEDVSPVIPFQHLNILNDYCDTFLAGSDQVWAYDINKEFNMAFMLNFVNDSNKKISFASSFGHNDDGTPKNKQDMVKKLLQRFDAISVRESNGVKLCHDKYGVNAISVMEPVFCVDKQIFQYLAEKSNLSIDDPYILTYILDPSPEKREAILYYSKESGKKAYNILDGDPRFYENNKIALDLPDTMAGIGAEDFIYLFMNADFIITDSFHGTAFSLIFNKPFLAISNNKRGPIRFKEILGKVDLLERFSGDPKNIMLEKDLLKEIDYTEINKIICSEKERSLEWLNWAIETPTHQMPSNILPQNTVTKKLEMSMCSGCGACVNSCPADALELYPNQLGYYNPVLKEDKCMNCGICIQSCTVLNPLEKKNEKNPKSYAFIAADKELLYNSSSGGVFALLAELAFERQGVVVGAAWKNDFSVEHVLIEEKKNLQKLQKSKYLQSYVGKIFKDVRKRLEQGQFVLFSGCPCQVAGLQAYLGKEYENLILVDLFCGNSPSTMFFRKYLKEDFPKGIKQYEFRYKETGWNPFTVKVIKNDETSEIRYGGTQDNYQRVYHNHVMCAPHCEHCMYQSEPRYGDITIGDFWGGTKYIGDVDAKPGLSVVLINNKKGNDLFEQISKEKIKLKREVSLDCLGGNGYVLGNHNWASAKRNDFYDAIKSMSFQEAADYALKPNHGKRDSFQSDKVSVLYHSSKRLHFNFDSDFWDETTMFGYQTLMVRPGESKPGRYACLPLYDNLRRGKTYRLRFRFRVNTESDYLNLHIKDSGTDLYQLIYSYKVIHTDEWLLVDISFVPQSGIFDEFMIGASQLSGYGNYLCIDYIHIFEA